MCNVVSNNLSKNVLVEEKGILKYLIGSDERIFAQFQKSIFDKLLKYDKSNPEILKTFQILSKPVLYEPEVKISAGRSCRENDHKLEGNLTLVLQKLQPHLAGRIVTHLLEVCDSDMIRMLESYESPKDNSPDSEDQFEQVKCIV